MRQRVNLGAWKSTITQHPDGACAMRSRLIAFIVLAVVVTWLVANNIPPSLASAAQSGGGPQKWEYTTAKFMADVKDQLNNLGDAGWEVCGVTGPDTSIIILKRRK
jgi:hypothetical protein